VVPPDATRPFKVVIVYDDFAAGERAVRMLTRLRDESHPQVTLSPVPWSFDYLAELPWRSLALHDVDAADLLVFSISHLEEVSNSINCWITASLHRNRVQSIPVLALFGDDEVCSLSLQSMSAVASCPPELARRTRPHTASRTPKRSSSPLISPPLQTATLN
jgi:hypothetical protein